MIKNTLKEVDPLHYFVPYNKSPACAIVYQCTVLNPRLDFVSFTFQIISENPGMIFALPARIPLRRAHLMKVLTLQL